MTVFFDGVEFRTLKFNSVLLLLSINLLFVLYTRLKVTAALIGTLTGQAFVLSVKLTRHVHSDPFKTLETK